VRCTLLHRTVIQQCYAEIVKKGRLWMETI
jgi:hypothetical protein